MANKKMDLSRYKRSTNGLMEFVLLIEQSDPSLRAKILEDAKAEDADFVWEVMKKVVFFEELVFLDDGVLTEIVSNCSPKLLAYALRRTPAEFSSKVTKMLGFREQRLIKDEEEKMALDTPEGLIQGAQKQILKLARNLETKGKIVFVLDECPRFQNQKKSAA